LFKDASRAAELAEWMKITADDLLRFGAIDEIVPEPRGGAHRDPERQMESLRTAIWNHLQPLMAMSAEELIQDRYDKFRKIGKFAFLQEAVEQL